MNKLKNETYNSLKETFGSRMLENEVLAPYMSMKVGGPANYIFKPAGEEEVRLVLKVLTDEDIPYYVMGNGSNIIVRDEGYDGAIIMLGEDFSDIKIKGTTMHVQAGALLKDAAQAAAGHCLTGLEFASGIPGSTGGAVTMNAGAYDGEMKDVLVSIKALSRDGRVVLIPAREADLSYRHSIFSSGDFIVLEAEIKLEYGDPAEIYAVMEDLAQRRSEKQPLEFPSCGSTFKRPEGYFAGKLIMDSGLRGARVGGASVSEKHCGFVVNDRNGTAADVLGVIELVKRTVKGKQGVDLECEVKIL